MSISQENVQSVALTVKSKSHNNHLNVYTLVNLKVGGNPWPNPSRRGQSRAGAPDGAESELASMQIFLYLLICVMRYRHMTPYHLLTVLAGFT